MIHRLKLLQAVQAEIEEERSFKSDEYSIGFGTGPKIPMSLFVENRKRLSEKMNCIDRMAIIYMEGGKFPKDLNDETLDTFHQEPFFFWVFGVLEPNFIGAIDVLEDQSFLFYPTNSRYSVEDQNMIKQQYQVDFVESKDDIINILSKFKQRNVLLPCGRSTVAKRSNYNTYCSHSTAITNFSLNYTLLFPVLCELRATKIRAEIDVMSFVTGIVGNGLRYVMSCMTPGMEEYKAVSLFAMYVSKIGCCKANEYENICLTSSNSKMLLHYAHGEFNDGKITENDMCILDMGCNYFGYNAKLAVTFPLNGVFNEDQKSLYELVLNVREEIYSHIGRGITLADLNKFAAMRALAQLKLDYDLLNHTVEELFEAGIQKVFMPHLCCHFIGLETQDVGERDISHCSEIVKNEETPPRYLGPGMIIAVGPGCFFIEELIDRALENPSQRNYFRDKINEFKGFGGVLLKDMVLITEFGYKILSDLPRKVKDLENMLDEISYNVARKKTKFLKNNCAVLR